jgi:hypothetical protein
MSLFARYLFFRRVHRAAALIRRSGDVSLILWELGIRNFVIGVTVRIASEEANLRRERAYLNKLNLALVQVRDREYLAVRFQRGRYN